jgi:hypothetical protein
MTPARAGLGEAGCRAARRREAVYRRSGRGPSALGRRCFAIGSVKGGWESGMGEGFGGSPEPMLTCLRPTPRLCGESVTVTGNLHSTTTPAPHPSPVVLRMFFMHSSTGRASRAGIVVLCRFLAGAMAPAPFPFPAPLKEPTPSRVAAARARPARRESTATVRPTRTRPFLNLRAEAG